MTQSEKPNLRPVSEIDSQARVGVSGARATLCFGLMLLLFLQTLTVWLESIYKIGLTKLSMGPESGALLFVLAPLMLLLLPARADRMVLRGSVSVFLCARALIPTTGVGIGVAVAGMGTAAFLVALCLMLSRKFRFLSGDAGVAMGLAMLGSITLRAWGATYDFTLGRPGAAVGWLIIGTALGLFWNLLSGVKIDVSEKQTTRGAVFGPVIGLFSNLTVVYLVLSCPGVVEAWLGFDNTWGLALCIFAMGGAGIVLVKGFEIPRAWLVVGNLLFALALVGGILALRIDFPATPESAATVVRPENLLASGMLNLMFLLSPVVLLNVRAACRSLAETASVRRLAIPVSLGGMLLIFLTIMSIFTNVWGYVGTFSAVFRNQFHLPFLIATALMVGVLFLPDGSAAIWGRHRSPVDRRLAGVMLALVVSGLMGTWWNRPASPPATASAEQLTVLTYNLQQGADLYGNRNWENQLAFLRRVNADLIGLQESDTARPSNGNVAAAKFFGAKLGYHIYYGPNTVSGTYGTAILSRLPLKNPRTFFTFSEQDEIGTAMAEIELEGRTIAFFNSHPSGKVPKQRQAEELVRQVKAYEHVIAVGDYNTAPGEEPYRTIAAELQESWSDKYPGGVGELPPAMRPVREVQSQASSEAISGSGDKITLPDRIDHVFVSKSFRVVEAYYLPAPDSQTDHPAHWAVVKWEREERPEGARVK